MIVECIKNVYADDDGALWNKAGNKYDAMINDDSYVIVNEEGVQHWIYAKGDKELEQFFYEHFKIVKGKGIPSRLEDMISEFYQTEDLSIDELVNEMIDHSEDKNDMAASIYSLLIHLNRTI